MKNFITLLLIACIGNTYAQVSNVQEQQKLQELYQKFRTKEIQDSIQIAQITRQGGVLFLEEDGRDIIGLVGLEENGFPIFYGTDNLNAARTVGTNLVVAGAANGYGLTGNGMVIGEWDGGSVLTTHQEFGTRVTQIDNPSSNSDHATHVAGTMIASGVVANAKGMATAATIKAYDFYNDDSEMTTFAATGRISNHSYGRITGWREMSNGDWRWYGDTAISGTEDYMFGFYSSNARSWDLIANAAPNYLIVKSAGNDRNDVPPASVNSHFIYHNGNWITSTTSRPQDGGTTGYDCISSSGNAKNILTVGAVGDIPNGWTQPSDVNMSSFSGWGPTDDGRIKPDIVANGVSLYSSGAANNTDYYSSSGTSMSAPNATGSMALLQEMYNDSNSAYMTASSLKALVIHTANEAGLAGPDFQFGWGLLNMKGAADLIADTLTNRIIEANLSNNSTDTYTYYSDGSSDIEATIVWNDPAHSVPAASLDPTTSMLVNDLDLRISDGTTTKMPWTPNSATPSVAATTGDNIKDNVEKVVFANPGVGTFTFTVTHKGTLASSQDYSLIISGIQLTPAVQAPTPSFTSTATTICQGDSVYFTDTSTGSPTSLSWVFAGGSPATSTSATPAVGYPTAGTYTVKLYSTNAGGTDSIVQTNYITVNPAPTVTTTPLPHACMFNGMVPLTGGMPAGGTWTGPHLFNQSFDPQVSGVGTFTLTYSVISGGCTGSSTEDITVTVPPTVSFPAFTASFCDNSSSFTLGGATPAGGTYSGPGVTNNVFDPAAAGLGTHTISYSYTDSAGCSGTASTTINVIPGVAVSIGTYSDICENAPVLTLTGGTPSGGYYAGTGVDTLAGTFDPSIAGAGTHTITYFGSGGLCLSAASTTILVKASPVVTFAPLADECVSNTSLLLSGGMPTGGLYTGTGVNNGVFDASAAGLGAHMIYYSFTDVTTTCSAMDSSAINVVNSIQYSLQDTSVCEGSTAFTLNSGLPSGGIYLGTGVAGNTFDPTVAGVGIHVITYTDPNNPCAISGTNTITVTANPVVTLAPFGSICLNGGNVALSGGLPTGGTYSGTGITNNIIDPTVNGLGVINITYTVTDNGCTGSATQPATIDMGSPEITNIRTSYCVNENSVILLGNPVGGVYSGSGITDSIFDPNAAGVGFHNITYTTTGGCAGTTSYGIQVNPKPVIGTVTGPRISSQGNVAAYNVNAQNGSYYSWIATGGNIVTTNNNQITVNWDTSATGILQVAIFDQNGCSDTTSITVNLWPVNIEEIDNQVEVILFPNPVREILNFEADLIRPMNLALVVLNAAGQQVYQQQKSFDSGKMEWMVNASNWSNGSYFYTIKSENSILSKGQFLKQ